MALTAFVQIWLEVRISRFPEKIQGFFLEIILYLFKYIFLFSTSKYFFLKAEMDRLLNENRSLQELLEACRSAHFEDKNQSIPV